MIRTAATLATVALLYAGNTARAADTGRSDEAAYLTYCGACHGPEGKGDGVAGTFMRPKPPDLTQIAKKNGGTFPIRQTMAYIDGRATVRAHGDPDMPVWGMIFQDQPEWDVRRRTEVQEKLRLITEYLATIQEK